MTAFLPVICILSFSIAYAVTMHFGMKRIQRRKDREFDRELERRRAEMRRKNLAWEQNIRQAHAERWPRV